MYRFPALDLKAAAAARGLDRVGIIRAVPSPHLDAYFRWLEAGYHGTMAYLSRPDRLERRRDLNVILPGVQSLVVVGCDYYTQAIPPAILADPSRGRIAAYAWGQDYHDVLAARLEDLAAWLLAAAGNGAAQRVYVDTGPLLERSHAWMGGLGFIGKNTMLIHPRRGSHLFLGEILTTLEFDAYDTPGRAAMCGTCARCLTACPTAAFPEPYVLDARRCISYLTIEHKGWIPAELRPLMGNWVFGCDVCQDVCPFQRFARPTPVAAFYPPDVDRAAPPLLDLLALDEAGFRERYYGTPLYRIKRDRLVRNACVAAGNWGDPAVVPALERRLSDRSPLVRGHAAWALARIQGQRAAPLIAAHLEHETDPEARRELLAATRPDDDRA